MSELTLGDLDPYRNLDEREVLRAVCAIDSFQRLNGEARAQQNGLSPGDALQRFWYEPFDSTDRTSRYDRAFSFDVANIDRPCLTKKGKKQSPAFATFCRRSGILDDTGGSFKLSAMGLAVLNRIITPPEFIFSVLMKQGVYIDDQYGDKFLVCIAQHLLSGSTFSKNQEQAKKEVAEVIAQYFNVNGFSNEEERTDLLFNALRVAGLLCLTADGRQLVPSDAGKEIFADVLKNKSRFSTTPVDAKAKDAYMRDPHKGVFEILDLSNKELYYKYFPGLRKLFEEDNGDQDNSKDVGKEEVLNKAVKQVDRKPYDKSKGIEKKFGSDAEDQLMLRILAALRTKPFVILAGHSGTGKSRMVKKLAYMTCRDNALHEGSDPGNYCMIEVKPNWHDSTDLLGYSSSFEGKHYVVKPLIEFIQKAYAYPDVPFFVCLDEMNLAPVEQYFAEFLSALEDIHEDDEAMNGYFALNESYKPESGSAAEEVVKYTSAPLVKALEYFDAPEMLEPKFNESRDWVKTHGLTIPKNLFVVGTVNMDETTNQFSRKVLDRAFTIEMTDAQFEDFGDASKDPAPTFIKEDDINHHLIDALLMGKKQCDKPLTKKHDSANANEPNGQLENMNAIKGILADTPFVVAYRFANEYALYEDALNVLDGTDKSGNSKAAANARKAFDDIVLMKLLPRIAGEAAVVKAIFKGVKKSNGTEEKSGLLDLLKCSDKGDQAGDTASGKKMREILRRGEHLLYLTFWP